MKTDNDKATNSEKIRIGDLAKKLNVEKFVIRFWEREFGIKSRRSEGGQRYYTQRDIERIELIKKLLHEEGLTIAGAKKYLQSQKATDKKPNRQVIAATKLVTQSPAPMNDTSNEEILCEHLLLIRDQLLELRRMLS